VAAPVESFENREQSESTFHLRCSQACVSDNLTDTVAWFTAEGFMLDIRGYTHPAPEPEEEKEEENE
jgi:hypothetical protein